MAAPRTQSQAEQHSPDSDEASGMPGDGAAPPRRAAHLARNGLILLNVVVWLLLILGACWLVS